MRLVSSIFGSRTVTDNLFVGTVIDRTSHLGDKLVKKAVIERPGDEEGGDGEQEPLEAVQGGMGARLLAGGSNCGLGGR